MDNNGGKQKAYHSQLNVGLNNRYVNHCNNFINENHSNLLEQLLRCSKNIERDLGNRFRKQFRQSFSRFDLLTRLQQLSTLESQDEWVAIGQIASQLMSSNGNITGLVNRMVAEGLIDRRDNRHDRRSVEICLTEKGKCIHDDMHHAYIDWSETLLLEHLNTIDRDQFNKAAIPKT